MIFDCAIEFYNRNPQNFNPEVLVINFTGEIRMCKFRRWHTQNIMLCEYSYIQDEILYRQQQKNYVVLCNSIS